MQFGVAESGTHYYLDLALDDMLLGLTRRVTFRYQVLGELPFNEDNDSPSRLFPVILPAAYTRATVIPEPGTGLMVSLGLVGMALRRRARKRNETRESQGTLQSC